MVSKKVVKEKKPKKLSQSRPARWGRAIENGMAAVNDMREAVETFTEPKVDKTGKAEARARFDTARDDLASALSELEGLKDEYSEWLSNLPESLHQSALGEKLQAMEDMDTDSVAINDIGDEPEDSIQEAEDKLSECESAELPRGFGND